MAWGRGANGRVRREQANEMTLVSMRQSQARTERLRRVASHALFLHPCPFCQHIGRSTRRELATVQREQKAQHRSAGSPVRPVNHDCHIPALPPTAHSRALGQGWPLSHKLVHKRLQRRHILNVLVRPDPLVVYWAIERDALHRFQGGCRTA